MSLDSAVHVVVYDPQVFDLSEAQAEQHQSCIHHSLHSTVQSSHICKPKGPDVYIIDIKYKGTHAHIDTAKSRIFSVLQLLRLRGAGDDKLKTDI